jgi:hypothetical protein
MSLVALDCRNQSPPVWGVFKAEAPQLIRGFVRGEGLSSKRLVILEAGTCSNAKRIRPLGLEKI